MLNAKNVEGLTMSIFVSRQLNCNASFKNSEEPCQFLPLVVRSSSWYSIPSQCPKLHVDITLVLFKVIFPCTCRTGASKSGEGWYLSLSPTIVTRPLHFESRSDAPVDAAINDKLKYLNGFHVTVRYRNVPTIALCQLQSSVKQLNIVHTVRKRFHEC